MVSAVSRLLGQNNFIVIVNVEFSTIANNLKKTPSLQSSKSSSNGYTPIPGLLPTVPSRDRSFSKAGLEGGRM